MASTTPQTQQQLPDQIFTKSDEPAQPPRPVTRESKKASHSRTISEASLSAMEDDISVQTQQTRTQWRPRKCVEIPNCNLTTLERSQESREMKRADRSQHCGKSPVKPMCYCLRTRNGIRSNNNCIRRTKSNNGSLCVIFIFMFCFSHSHTSHLTSPRKQCRLPMHTLSRSSPSSEHAFARSRSSIVHAYFSSSK